MSEDAPAVTGVPAASITEQIRASGLDPSLLYEVVIESTDEGQLTAGCINAAAGILLTQLGLPEYFFRHISKDSLKRVLRAIGRNLKRRGSRFLLRGEVAEVQFDVDRGVQVRIATRETRDRMEALLDAVMAGRRVAYYFGRKYGYFTYLIFPEPCPSLEAVAEGSSPFAFAQNPDDPSRSEATRTRYEGFLDRARSRVVPLVELSRAKPSNEIRIMFHDDFARSALPAIRKMLDDLGMVLNRAYWETYRGATGQMESICSLYVEDGPSDGRIQEAVSRLRALLALPQTELDELYVYGPLAFEEYLFAVCAYLFAHEFIYKDSPADREIMEALEQEELRAAMGTRIYTGNRSEYSRKVISEAITVHSDLIERLYRLFDRRFNPRYKKALSERTLRRRLREFERKLAVRFLDDTTSYDIFLFMTRLITDCRKTNFYQRAKRSFAFRFDAGVLDPLVFSERVHGIFLVLGFHSIGTHMRAEEIARGGLRLIRVTDSNFENELDSMPLLNYALGPVAQRLKHKDIPESGAKGVIVPLPQYSGDSLRCVFDYTEGIMDLMLRSEEVVDHLGSPEMIFFGPDEGTAPLMDAVAARARERGYKYWRTITTGKTIGIPHDTYGLTEDGKVFGLIARGDDGTELQVNGTRRFVAAEADRVVAEIGHRVRASGMTTVSVMATFRTVLQHLGLEESAVNLMMTGGPDGDLGANEIQTFKGRICLMIDGGSVLFDPEGLDRDELLKLAVARHTSPRLNSAEYPEKRLSRHGFKVLRSAKNIKLPDGEAIEDGAYFHRHFLDTPRWRKYVERANIQAFVPCGGFKDTINARNVGEFLELFRELRVIVEGANVFFDDTARQTIADESEILQIRDSTANKGGVTCSAIAEVLSAFLLGEEYERVLVQDRKAKSRLIGEVLDLIHSNAVAETRMLLALHEAEGAPLYKLSVQTSERLFELQASLSSRLERIRRHRDIMDRTLESAIPPVLVECVGMKRIRRVLNGPELRAYRDALLTKRLAALAVYRHATEWIEFLQRLETNFAGTLRGLLEEQNA